MQKKSYTIRAMTRQEVNIAIEWAVAEGWNPGIGDAECFHTADSGGFLVGLLGDEPISTISVVKYGDTYGFLGFYIVKSGHRGRGYGLRIWEAGLVRLEGRTIGLDGVIAQQDNYKKSGFRLVCRNIRYQGVGGGKVADSPEIVELSAIPFKAVRDYDRPFFPDDRTAFLQAWIAQPGCMALGVMQNGALAGYGVLRSCRIGHKIGPLFADTPELAERIFLAFKARVAEDVPFFLDVPELNAAALDLVKRHRMTASFETARMYKGTAPELPLNRLFGVTTFELG